MKKVGALPPGPWFLSPFQVPAYAHLAKFMLEITTLPHNVAEVETTFSKGNANNTELRGTLNGIVWKSEYFSANIQVAGGLKALHRNKRPIYMPCFNVMEKTTVG